MLRRAATEKKKSPRILQKWETSKAKKLGNEHTQSLKRKGENIIVVLGLMGGNSFLELPGCPDSLWAYPKCINKTQLSTSKRFPSSSSWALHLEGDMHL